MEKIDTDYKQRNKLIKPFNYDCAPSTERFHKSVRSFREAEIYTLLDPRELNRNNSNLWHNVRRQEPLGNEND